MSVINVSFVLYRVVYLLVLGVELERKPGIVLGRVPVHEQMVTAPCGGRLQGARATKLHSSSSRMQRNRGWFVMVMLLF